MKQKIKEKINTTKIVATRSLVAVLGVLIGILIMAQWHSVPDRVTNPITPYTSLRETKESLYDEQDELKKEIKTLQLSIDQIQKDSEDSALTKDEVEDLRNKKVLAGLTKLNGPGLIITLDDSKTVATSDESIIHAADLRDIINTLWGGGAEAISINNQRIVINSAIDCIVNLILVNNTRIAAPFKIEAIGNQNKMFAKVSGATSLQDLFQRKREQGITFIIQRNNDITVPAYDGSFEFKKSGVAK